MPDITLFCEPGHIVRAGVRGPVRRALSVRKLPATPLTRLCRGPSQRGGLSRPTWSRIPHLDARKG